MKQIFFQSSMPRSGSTMFQNIIGQNPDFYVTPTSGVLDMLYSARQTFNTLPETKAQDRSIVEPAFLGFCSGALQGYFNAITTKEYILDKSRGWGIYRDFTNAFYPNPKIVCFVRDLKDVVCSFEKIYRDNLPLNDNLRDESQAKNTTIHKRVDEWMHPANPVGRAVERIFEIIRRGYEDKILFIRYEDFCLYPESNMVKVYDYFGLPYFQHDFDNIEQVTQEDDDAFGIGKNIHTIRPKLISKQSDAKQILGQDICEWLYNTYTWYYQKFNYKK
jgi:sulfotransferase